jgi:hypothetical protein
MSVPILKDYANTLRLLNERVGPAKPDETLAQRVKALLDRPDAEQTLEWAEPRLDGRALSALLKQR